MKLSYPGEPAAESKQALAGFRTDVRRKQVSSLLFLAPVLILLAVLFVAPLAGMLGNSVRAPEVPQILWRTAAAMGHWEPTALPDEAVYRALVLDLREAYAEHTIGVVAARLNHEHPGFRRLLLTTARHALAFDLRAARHAVVSFNAKWGDINTWRYINAARHPYTARYLLAGLDLSIDPAGGIVRVPSEKRIHLQLLRQTLWISFIVTALCLAVGYPLAHAMAMAPGRWGALLLVLVLLPFWTSSLVRTVAWMVLLQKDGIVNTLLLGLGLVAAPLQLMFNRFSVYVAMTYVLLPFMVLPLYSVMKTVRVEQLRAAESLGAQPLAAFLTVYLPQTMPGIVSGSVLVFIQTLGFYVTPALVGGPRDQMFSMVITNYALGTANWNMAAALSVILLLCILALYPLCSSLSGVVGIVRRGS